MLPLTIRAARAADAPAMVDVRREAILAKGRPYEQHTVNAWASDALPDRAVRYVHEIADPGFIVLIAESGDDVIGFATAIPATCELSAIYVKPNPIGRVGTALLSELEKRVFQTAEAMSCIAALSAVPFYESNGYAEQESIDYIDRTGATVPCIQMRKARPAAGR